jgi:branched-chain amino acid transport system permease protein
MTQFVFNGLAYGAFLYLVSVALVFVLGLRHVANFAHGSLFMLGAFISFSLSSRGHFFLGMLLAAIVLAVIGALMDVFIFRPLQRHDHVVTMLVTYGVLLVLQDFAQSVWGKGSQLVKVPPYLDGSVVVLGESFALYRLFVIGIALVVAVGLTIWLKSSRIGLYVRALSSDALTTAAQGVNTDRVGMAVMALGSALAGVAGAIAAPLLSVSVEMGAYVLIDAFVVVVIGGLRSFSGVFVAAILLGQLQYFGIAYAPWAASIIPFVAMVGVLLWRPTGFGRAGA